MKRSWILLGCLIFGLGWLVASNGGTVRAQEDKTSLNDVNLDVSALQFLFQLQMNRSQLLTLHKLAQETSDKPPARRPAKASNDFRTAMADLREALIKGDNREKIDELIEKVDDLRDQENPELDDEIEVTDEARMRAPEVFRLLSARQLAVYFGSIADEVFDPIDIIFDAMDRVRAVKKDEEWKQLREQASEEVGRLLAGVNSDKASELGDKVLQLLIIARGLSDKEFKESHADLQKQAEVIIGNVGPTEVLRNLAEIRLAELLSNPRLSTVLEARLKQFN